MINLFPFQAEAVAAMADRYRDFATDSDRPKRKNFGPVPFFQTLRALTGAGKTPILAATVSQMRTAAPVEPVVLWISKGKVVVDQTLANFEEGGKYAELIERFTPKALRDATPADVEDGSTGLILLGTVATFNSKERGDRRIFGVAPDVGGISLWQALIDRRTTSGARRPLFIVYDEGHNLTDQQGEILMELRPDALLVASATPQLPPTITEMIDFLKLNYYEEEDLTTSIRSTAVVDAQLVKREIQLGGYVTSEEVAISALLEDHRALVMATERQGEPITPKCIYVCKTNVPGDVTLPFAARKAPPIRIWRYLVEQQGIDPAHIAVYCDLHVSSAQPLPEEFVLFKGGDSDYATFIGGDYRHIIFNLSLQEGWDDPECYLAYIDKSMAAELQVEQIIGRVLRQPKARYYPDPRLNTAGFYIHIDEAGVFRQVLRSVQERIAQDLPGVEVRSTGGQRRSLKYQPPRIDVQLPIVRLKTGEADGEVTRVLDDVEDYAGNPDAQATGRVAQVAQQIGHGGAAEVEWVNKGQGMPVTVEWLLTREIERQYPAALGPLQTFVTPEARGITRPLHLRLPAAEPCPGGSRRRD